MSDNPDVHDKTPLAEYFARDPHQHTEQSLAAIVGHLRTQRKKFKMGDKSAGSPKPKTATALKQEAAMEVGKDLLGDLDL